MADRLRELLDLVIRSVYDPKANGRRLAERAGVSRDHLHRLSSAATGETPVAMRRVRHPLPSSRGPRDPGSTRAHAAGWG